MVGIDKASLTPLETIRGPCEKPQWQWQWQWQCRRRRSLRRAAGGLRTVPPAPLPTNNPQCYY